MKRISIFLALLLTCSLLFAACGSDGNNDPTGSSTTGSDGTYIWAEGTVVTDIGTGSTVFALIVEAEDGTESCFNVHTDAKTVGEALAPLDGFVIVDGMVTTVNGRTLDWNTDQAYWAFEINGEYATKGVNETPIELKTYSFVYTPA